MFGSNAEKAANARFHRWGHSRGANAAASTPNLVEVNQPLATPAATLPPAVVTAAYANVAVAELTIRVAATMTHVGVPAVLRTNDTVIATVKYVNAIAQASPVCNEVP